MVNREVAFVGRSNSGKTTLLEAVVRAVAARGLRVAVVKHTHHDIDWDTEGKDSWRFREAGAAAVVLRTPRWNFAEAPRSGAADEWANGPAGADLVIHEGNRGSGLPKVLFRESVTEARARETAGPIIAIVGGSPEVGVPAFDRDDVEALVSFLLSMTVEHPAGEGFEDLLERSVAAHGHLCPGQVLGVRVTMRGLRELGMPIPPPRKRLIAVVETDRCATDAVASVTGCSLGKRSLKFRDFGKMAAAFLDLETGRAVRVAVRDDSRERVQQYVPGGADPHEAQTRAYKLMPDEELLVVQDVRLSLSEGDLPGRPRNRVACAGCGEHVSDDRHVTLEGRAYCRGCAGESYYEMV